MDSIGCQRVQRQCLVFYASGTPIAARPLARASRVYTSRAEGPSLFFFPCKRGRVKKPAFALEFAPFSFIIELFPTVSPPPGHFTLRLISRERKTLTCDFGYDNAAIHAFHLESNLWRMYPVFGGQGGVGTGLSFSEKRDRGKRKRGIRKKIVESGEKLYGAWWFARSREQNSDVYALCSDLAFDFLVPSTSFTLLSRCRVAWFGHRSSFVEDAFC